MTPRDSPGRIARFTAMSMLATEVAIHAKLAPDHLTEVPYIGALFVLASVVLTVGLIALAIAPRSPLPWVISGGACAAVFISFVISRTVGLPGFHEAWSADGGLGLASLPPELLVIVVALRSFPGRLHLVARVDGLVGHNAHGRAVSRFTPLRRWT